MMSPEIDEIRLIDAIKRLKVPRIRQEKKLIIKNRVMGLISRSKIRPQEEVLPSQFETLKRAIKRIAQEINPKETFKTHLLRKILALIDTAPVPRFSFWNIFVSRKALTFATLLIFSVATFFSFFGNSDRALAAPLSFFENVRGEVQVIRRGEIYRGIRHFRLRQNDIIQTDPNAQVTIHFLDDSVSRLAENSSLKINRLFVDPQDHTDTTVSVSLVKGRLYASIVNLVNNSAMFEVKAMNVVATARTKSAFDVSVVKGGKTKIAVVQHSVDVKVSEKKKPAVETTLTNGFSMEVENGSSRVKKPVRGKENDEWISQNLSQDEKYLDDLKEEYHSRRQEEAGNAPLLNFSDFDRISAKLSAASAKLIQAETLFQTGHEDDAKKLLAEFETLISGVKAQQDGWKTTDPEKALRLQDMLTRTFNDYRKQFTIYLPSDVLYPLKERIATVELSVTSDSVEKSEKQLAQAEEKLIEAATLQTQGNSILAAAQVEAYSAQVAEVTEDIKQLPEGEQEEAVSALLEQKTDHLKLLGALAQTAKFQKPPVLKPGETRGISLGEVLVKATQDSLLETNEVIAETNVTGAEEKIEEMNDVQVNGESVVAALLPAPVVAPAVSEKTPDTSIIEIIADTSLSGVTVIQIQAVSSPPPLPSE